jgi:alpha-mannosidase
LITRPENRSESFFVFNPLSWTRTDYSDFPYNGTPEIKIVDKISSEEVPFQFITKKNMKFLRILAKDVPSLGFKVFEIKKASSAKRYGKAANVAGNTVENKYYKIVFTPQGVIKSLVDKSNNNRECITPINNLYANDMGAGEENPGTPLRFENEGAVSITLVAESDKPLKHTSKLTLFGFNDRIELENCITENFGAKPVTYSFSFGLKSPDTWSEEAGSILKVKQKSEGGNYADSICRLDWVVMNHFAGMYDGNNGMIISNRDAFMMKTGNSTVSTLDGTTPQIHILAGGQIDAPDLGIVNQDGDSYFEDYFALKPDRNGFNAAGSMRFSLEHQNPLVAGMITGESSTYGSTFSLFSLSDPDDIVWSVKPAEEGIDNGIILRVWNVNNKQSSCMLSSASP